VSAVFKKFLVKNKPGHVSGQWANLNDVIEWIKAANGQAVIAHPARYKMSATKLRRLMEAFKEAGGVGIEVVSGSNRTNDRHNLAQYARRYELYASSGSDYHGPENPWIELGRLEALPSGCEPIWTLWEEA
jgi:predicted metal-dependent phosphoesterase TrpH